MQGEVGIEVDVVVVVVGAMVVEGAVAVSLAVVTGYNVRESENEGLSVNATSSELGFGDGRCLCW
jgi:hypothetical protein